MEILVRCAACGLKETLVTETASAHQCAIERHREYDSQCLKPPEIFELVDLKNGHRSKTAMPQMPLGDLRQVSCQYQYCRNNHKGLCTQPTITIGQFGLCQDRTRQTTRDRNQRG